MYLQPQNYSCQFFLFATHKCYKPPSLSGELSHCLITAGFKYEIAACDLMEVAVIKTWDIMISPLQGTEGGEGRLIINWIIHIGTGGLSSLILKLKWGYEPGQVAEEPKISGSQMGNLHWTSLEDTWTTHGIEATKIHILSQQNRAVLQWPDQKFC